MHAFQNYGTAQDNSYSIIDNDNKDPDKAVYLRTIQLLEEKVAGLERQLRVTK